LSCVIPAAEGNPANLTLCRRGEWEERILVETVVAMLTGVCHCKKVMHRVWAYFQARLAFTLAAFNVLVQWYGLRPNAQGFVPLSMAEFICKVLALLITRQKPHTLWAWLHDHTAGWRSPGGRHVALPGLPVCSEGICLVSAPRPPRRRSPLLQAGASVVRLAYVLHNV